MPTLSQLRRRVDALKRKYASKLAVVRLRHLAEDFSQQWAREVAECRPAPQSHTFIRRIAQRGFRLTTFMALKNYLERCHSEKSIPDCIGIISSLLPQVPCDRLSEMLRWDAPALADAASRVRAWPLGNLKSPIPTGSPPYRWFCNLPTPAPQC